MGASLLPPLVVAFGFRIRVHAEENKSKTSTGSGSCICSMPQPFELSKKAAWPVYACLKVSRIGLGEYLFLSFQHHLFSLPVLSAYFPAPESKNVPCKIMSLGPLWSELLDPDTPWTQSNTRSSDAPERTNNMAKTEAFRLGSDVTSRMQHNVILFMWLLFSLSSSFQWSNESWWIWVECEDSRAITLLKWTVQILQLLS